MRIEYGPDKTPPEGAYKRYEMEVEYLETGRRDKMRFFGLTLEDAKSAADQECKRMNIKQLSEPEFCGYLDAFKIPEFDTSLRSSDLHSCETTQEQPTHAVRMIDNYLGYPEVVTVLAGYEDGVLYDIDTNDELLQREGDEILNVWSLEIGLDIDFNEE